MTAATATPVKQQQYRIDLPKSGEWVYWYSNGHKNEDPAPALVLRSMNEMRVGILEVHLPGGVVYRDSVHHMSAALSETAPKKLLASQGAWAWEHPERPETFKK